MNVIEFSKYDPKIAAIVRLVAPDYKGRKSVKVCEADKHYISDYWDGGSKNEAFVVRLNTLCLASLSDVGFQRQTQGNPYHQNMGECRIVVGFAVAERVYFCGKDLGVRIYLHHDDFVKFGE